MNSLLQTLFHLPAFRRAVNHMATGEGDVPERCIPLALQALFYNLQHGSVAASTKLLTRSFGWDSDDSFQQHDVQERSAPEAFYLPLTPLSTPLLQELNRVLCDNLDAKMKKTPVEGALARLFEGETSTYLECTRVEYTSERRCERGAARRGAPSGGALRGGARG